MPCRLIPLAISSIYEVTFSRETYSAQVAANASCAADSSHRDLALQLRDSLYELQHPALLDAADASAVRQAYAHHTLRHIMFRVRSVEAQSGYVGELQHAWQSAVSGYNERQAGNCLFWLFEEPQASSVTRQNSRSSTDTGSVASGYVQHHGQLFDDAGPSVQHAVAIQHQSPGEQSMHFTSASTANRHANETSGATRASTVNRTSSNHAARPAAHPGQGAHAGSGSGFGASHLVLVAVTAFAFGVLVCGYPRRSSGIDGLTRISETYLNAVGNLMTEVLEERQQNRRTANAQARARVYHH